MSEIRSTIVKKATVEAVITRADGRIEPLGVIGVYDPTPVGRAVTAVRDFIRKVVS